MTQEGRGAEGEASLGELVPVDPPGSMREWAERLVARAREDGVALTGEAGLLTDLMRHVLQTGLEVELTEHLGYEPHERGRGVAVHPCWNPHAIDDLRAVDAVLTRNGLPQPLVISESMYENAPVAAAIAEFMRTATRPVTEVMAWPLYLADTIVGQPRPAQPRCATLPSRIDEYAKALARRPTQQNPARRGRNQRRAIAADAVRPPRESTGRRSVHAHSQRPQCQVQLSSCRLSLRRTLCRAPQRTPFPGARTWTVMLQPGHFAFAADGPRKAHGSFEILAPGG